MKDVLEKIQRAYSVVRVRSPYLLGGVRSLILKPDESVPTAATTADYVCKYSVEFFRRISIEELAAVLAHEFLHPYLHHHERGKDLDSHLTNIAMDMTINAILTNCGFKLPQPCCMPHDIDCIDAYPRNWEYYYSILLTVEDKKWFRNKSESAAVMNGSCGSCTGSESEENAEDGVAESQEDKFRKITIDTAVTEKVIASMKAGTMPANVSAIFAEVIKLERVDWRTVLKNATVGAVSQYKRGAAGMSLMNVVRSLLPHGVVMSGPITKSPEIAIIVDTSGSMYDRKTIGECLGVTSDIITQLNLPYVWFFEADVISKRTPIRLKSKDLKGIRLEGGGGTSFVEPLQVAEKLKVDIIVYITDGIGAYPPIAPKQKVIWAMIKSNAKPAFGKYVRIGQ